MEQDNEDPGQPVQDPPPAYRPIDWERMRINRTFENQGIICRAFWKSDPHLEQTEIYEVPAPVVNTQPIPTTGRWRRPRTRPIPLKPETVKKQCWSVGRLFDAKVSTPQELFIATDGTLYCSFVNGRDMRYVEVTEEFLLAQSGSVRIFIDEELVSKRKVLLGEPDPYPEGYQTEHPEAS